MKKVPSQEVRRCDGTEKMRVHHRESVIGLALLSLTLPTNTQGVKRSLHRRQRRKAIFIVRTRKKLSNFTQHQPDNRHVFGVNEDYELKNNKEMNKSFNKISTKLMIMVMVGVTVLATACEKENATSTGRTTTEIKKKPTVATLAKVLGIKPEAIVRVEHKDGLYHSLDYTKPDGTKIHTWWCSEPVTASCVTVVYVRAGVKSAKTEENTFAHNGFIATRTDQNNRPQSVVLMFDRESLGAVSWIKDNTVVFQEKHPIINLNLMEGFDENQTLSVKKGSYKLENLDGISYFEVPVSDLIFEEGISIEK